MSEVEQKERRAPVSNVEFARIWRQEINANRSVKDVVIALNEKFESEIPYDEAYVNQKSTQVRNFFRQEAQEKGQVFAEVNGEKVPVHELLMPKVKKRSSSKSETLNLQSELASALAELRGESENSDESIDNPETE